MKVHPSISSKLYIKISENQISSITLKFCAILQHKNIFFLRENFKGLPQTGTQLFL